MRGLARATVFSHWFSYVTDFKDTALVFVLLLKEKKEVLGTSNNEANAA